MKSTRSVFEKSTCRDKRWLITTSSEEIKEWIQSWDFARNNSFSFETVSVKAGLARNKGITRPFEQTDAKNLPQSHYLIQHDSFDTGK